MFCGFSGFPPAALGGLCGYSLHLSGIRGSAFDAAKVLLVGDIHLFALEALLHPLLPGGRKY
jgi:hypothetical protein